MARLVVVSNPALADGFRLAGATAIPVGSREAMSVLRSLVAEPDVGLVLVTDDLWEAVPAKLRGALENLTQPIVLGLPSGAPDDPAVRRRLLGEMLERAIGYRIQVTGGSQP
jgi:vacuolar-type H+-ATPase subunit F/Vma7